MKQRMQETCAWCVGDAKERSVEGGFIPLGSALKNNQREGWHLHMSSHQAVLGTDLSGLKWMEAAVHF